MKKILFFIFAVLTLAFLIWTIIIFTASMQEFERVSEYPGEPSGVDYLAANMLKGEAVFFGILTFVNAVTATILGLFAFTAKE